MDAIWIIILTILALLLLLLLISVITFAIVLPKRIPAKIRGSHVFITGGSKGIGKMIAEEMLINGAKAVSIAARNVGDMDRAKEYLEQYCNEDQRVHIYKLDVTENYEIIQETIQKVVEESGPINILINNAGYVIQGGFSEIPVTSFENQVKINYISGALVTRAVIDYMKSVKNGHIAFVSSAAGQCAIWGYTAYSPSKFAVRGFAEALHMELLPFNIGVSILYPPNTATEGFEVEQQTMPEEVRLIGGTAGTFTAKEVAKTFVKNIMRGEFMTCIGLEGKLLGFLSAGAAPEPSIINALVQSTLGGLFREIMLIFIWTFNRAVQQCHDLKKQKIRSD